MDTQSLTYLFVGLSFSLYIGIAIWSRASSTNDFYIAGKGVHPIANGMATAADWMSAASFISMAGLIAFLGKDGSVYLMGWTGGYVLLALLLAPYLRKFGQYTVPDFIGTRYYSNLARLVAVICLIFISFTYVAGQMRGVGIVFSRFLEVDINLGVIIGMCIVFFYAVLGGMKGIKNSKKRPLAVNSSKNELIEIIKKRSIIYSKALYKIDCENFTKQQITKKIIDIYEAN